MSLNTKPGDLSLIPETHIVEGSCPLTPTCALHVVLMHTRINEMNTCVFLFCLCPLSLIDGWSDVSCMFPGAPLVLF